MGCDIHCFVEKRNTKTNNWEKITGFKSDWYRKDSSFFSSNEYKNRATSPIGSRNYTTFSVLAGVRNGRGYAGVDTGDPVTPISEQKGLPDDLCEEIKKESDGWGGDGHSHSFLTVSEIINYDTSTELIKRGVVTVSQYKTFLDKGSPDSWCGGVSGGNTEIISPDEIIEKSENDSTKSYYCKIQWTADLKDYCGNLFGDSLDQLKERCSSEDFDDVRIVFWFDN